MNQEFKKIIDNPYFSLRKLAFDGKHFDLTFSKKDYFNLLRVLDLCTKFGPFKDYLELWKSAIQNQTLMNHSLEKLPVLYLIEMNDIFSEFMSEFSTKMAMSKSQKRRLRAMLKKRMNWNEPSFVYSKLFFIRKLCNHTSTKIEHYSTIICQHCPPNDKLTKNPKTSEHPNQLTEQCSKCFVINAIVEY